MFSDSGGFPGASWGLDVSAVVSEKLEENVKILQHHYSIHKKNNKEGLQPVELQWLLSSPFSQFK